MYICMYVCIYVLCTYLVFSNHGAMSSMSTKEVVSGFAREKADGEVEAVQMTMAMAP